MYQLTRLCLLIAVILIAFCLVEAIILGWPLSGWFVGIAIVAHQVKRKRGRLTTLGSAQWADGTELCAAGMLNPNFGLSVGRLCGPRSGGLGIAIRSLFNLRLSARDASRNFWGSLAPFGGNVVRLARSVHVAVFSPSGGGKGVSCVLPHLYMSPDSNVVIDFKGENAQRTAKHRRRAFRHRVVLVDTYKMATKTPDCLNPIDFIDKNDPHAPDHCRDMAKSVVTRSPDEKDPHWNDSAEAFIAVIIMVVVYYGDRCDTRSLQTVLDIFSNPEKLETALKLARESDAWGGTLARMAGQLMYFTEKERSSVLTTVSRHLQFLNSMAVAESTSKSTFDPAKLRSGKMTVYLILPPDHMRAQSALLRLWIGTLLRAVVAGGLQEKRKIHFILDEAASLGHMEAIDDALDKYRGYGIRLQFYFQSLGQLKTCFPNGQDQTLLSNTSQVYFGVNDNATADYISARLGESTIVVDSGGTSSGGSYQSTKGQHPTYSYGNSYNSSRNWQQQTRKLLKPEEIMVLPPRTAITFTPGVRPICTTLLPYFENRRMRRGQGWLSRSVEACTMLAASVALCVAVGLGAEALSQSVNSQSMSIDWMPSGPRYVNHNYIGW